MYCYWPFQSNEYHDWYNQNHPPANTNTNVWQDRQILVITKPLMKEIPERNTHFSHTIDFPFSTSWYYQVSKQLPGWGKFSTTLPNNSLLWIAKSRCCCCFWHYITHVCLISPYHKYVHTKAKSYFNVQKLCHNIMKIPQTSAFHFEFSCQKLSKSIRFFMPD